MKSWDFKYFEKSKSYRNCFLFERYEQRSKNRRNYYKNIKLCTDLYKKVQFELFLFENIVESQDFLKLRENPAI